MSNVCVCGQMPKQFGLGFGMRPTTEDYYSIRWGPYLPMRMGTSAGIRLLELENFRLTHLYAAVTYRFKFRFACYPQLASQQVLSSYATIITTTIAFFMDALCNRGAIIFLPCSFFLLLSSSSFFPRLISAAADWMSAILLHMAWP